LDSGFDFTAVQQTTYTCIFLVEIGRTVLEMKRMKNNYKKGNLTEAKHVRSTIAAANSL
jgi:hypothetical protein